MSWQATAYVKTLSVSPSGHKITRSEKLLLMILADSIDPHSGWAWPSMALLAEESLFAERQIRRIIARMESNGFLEVQHAVGGRRSNRYRIIGVGTKCPNRNVLTRERCTDISESCTDISTPLLGHSYVRRVVEPIKAVEELNPLPPLETKTPSAEDQKQIQIDVYSAAKGLGELIGMNCNGRRLSTLTGAIEQAERRWPDKRREQVVEDIVALWREYTAQGIHSPVAIHNWLEGVGSYIDSDHWRKVKKPEFTPTLDWQGGYVGENGVYVNKHGKKVPGFVCPPKPKELAGD